MSELFKKRTQSLLEHAARLGFMQCGVAKARFLEEEAPRLEKWLKNDHHGKMAYMENHFEKRLDPTQLVPGAQSVISLSYNYFTSQQPVDSEAPKISKYAYGRDYHKVVKKKLKELVHVLQEEHGQFNARLFVDSAPVMEKKWAVEAGLGWIGKHTNLIAKQHGSFFFLCEIITDLEFDYNQPFATDHCGNCTRCIDACPTEAIHEQYGLDASKCIAYLTIELKEAIPDDFTGRMDNWMFGCDICQDVCPWNRFSIRHTEPQFEPSNELMGMTAQDWNALTEEAFDRLFTGSAVRRAGYQGLKRNLLFLETKKPC